MAQKGDGNRSAQDAEKKANWKLCMINLLAVFSLCCGDLSLSSELCQRNIWFVLSIVSPYGNKSDQMSRFLILLSAIVFYCIF